MTVMMVEHGLNDGDLRRDLGMMVMIVVVMIIIDRSAL